jgi:hypothetical protein
MKRILFLLCCLPFVSGCMYAIEQATGIQLSKNMNPVMELEMDLVFLDEIAAFTKLNEIILERIPVSMSDPWPELLNHYTIEPAKAELNAKEAYDTCLTNLLKEDFYFYRTYDYALYFNLIGGDSGGILARAIISARDLLIIEGAKELGRRYEHAKWVLSHHPFGCKCRYYSPRFLSLTPGSAPCLQATSRNDCPFFDKPTEEMLYTYLFGDNGFDSWVDLQVNPECFRTVEGEHLGSFENVYYTLLPGHLRQEIQKVDEQVQQTMGDLEQAKARQKGKDLSTAEKQALSKEEDRLEKSLEGLTEAQKKLYKTALTTLEVTPEKVEKAKKLLQIIKFLDNGFDQTSTAMTALTIKITDDLLALRSFGSNQVNASMTYLVTQGIASGSFAAKRAELLGKRIVTLPVNYAQTWGYAISQEYRIAKFKDYLEALVKMENKMKGA